MAENDPLQSLAVAPETIVLHGQAGTAEDDHAPSAGTAPEMVAQSEMPTGSQDSPRYQHMDYVDEQDHDNATVAYPDDMEVEAILATTLDEIGSADPNELVDLQ